MPKNKRNYYNSIPIDFFFLHEDDHVIHVHYAFSHKLFHQDSIEQDQVVLQPMFLLLLLPVLIKKNDKLNKKKNLLLDRLRQSFLIFIDIEISLALKDRPMDLCHY